MKLIGTRIVEAIEERAAAYRELPLWIWVVVGLLLGALVIWGT